MLTDVGQTSCRYLETFQGMYPTAPPQSKIRDFYQPCRARAPFVRFADIFPADGEICLPGGALGVNCLPGDYDEKSIDHQMVTDTFV